MKVYSPAYAAHLRQPVTTLAVCWRIVKRNGDLIMGTDHDRNIPITVTSIGMDVGSSPPFSLLGTYQAAAGITASDIKGGTDMSVDNMEVQGALDPDLFVDVSIADIEAGLLDTAEVTTFRVNWTDPDDFQDVLRHGTLGQIRWNSDREYRTELRGLTQRLQQTVGRTAGERCDVVEFGDSRCKFDIAAATVTGIITAVTSRRSFETDLDLDSPAPSSGYFNLGKITMTSGENQGYKRQVMNDSEGAVLGNIAVWEAFPLDLDVGDTFTLTPGCDRRYETCRDVHDNVINIRAPGLFMPGLGEIIRAP